MASVIFMRPEVAAPWEDQNGPAHKVSDKRKENGRYWMYTGNTKF